ncbi:hypothetical protein [Methylobacterium indicum]|uniref:Uncharacterized protein n=1 Tax=Methylobacterium indicum TaxID=1775910 RepID=A0A0J6RQT8_9HYPH|nr:hypothetical protein [Methylobacterium indicum]KMO17063.1 hypothetical protein QR79_22010 [Methylobacterium indicum]KMO23577.1 hypothetical protein QR78_03965 [Methylobacterium indicum]BCM81542.1 hypothetical protein mvi_00030 [Methylobacterium indicum]
MIVRPLVVAAAWAAFCFTAQPHREPASPQDPVLLSGIEADLASRRCDGVRIDAQHFRAFSSQAQLNHADFFQKTRSARLQAALDDLDGRLRTDRQAACTAIWVAYGPGSRLQLLRRG